MVVTIAIMPSCCICDKTVSVSVPVDKALFVDHHKHIDGRNLEGDYRGPMIDFPMYSFDNERKRLSGIFDFNVTDSLILVMGDGRSLSGAAGGGAGTSLTAGYAFPYERDGLVIENASSDGSVYIRYDNKTIFLKRGEKWVNEYTYVEDKAMGDGTAKVEFTVTDTIVNHGLIDKNSIVKGFR